MAKRYPSGFVPIPFKSAGKVLFPISLLMIIVGGARLFHGLGGNTYSGIVCRSRSLSS